MKFLCGNCKAKYQIADEKIAGRTLRMKCRRCSHDIVIRGTDQGGAQPARPARGGSHAGPAPRRRGGSSVGPAPVRSSRRPAGSALGADFRRQVSTGSHGVPARGAALDQWHVAINDVPVGPIRRDEIARKVAAGAVNGDSLCWREGFDDWRPVRDVPELAAVLRQRAVPPPRPARPMGRGSVPGASRGGTGTRPKPRTSTRSGTGIPARGDQSRPAARSNVVPIGGRLGAAAAPAYDEAPDELDAEPTRVSDPLFDPSQLAGMDADAGNLSGLAAGTSPQQESATPTFEDSLGAFAPQPQTESEIYEPRRARRALPIGAWIAIAGAGAFGMMLAFMVGTKLLLDDDGEQVATVQGTQPGTEAADQVEPELVTDVPDEAAPEEAPPEEGATEAEPEASGGSGGSSRTAPRRTGSSGGSGGGRSAKKLTDEQRALIERFSESGGGAANIDVGDEGSGGGSANTGHGLNARQLTSVVARNRPALRRCYETAIRGIGEPPAIRMDVELTVGRSGGVTRVNARGNDVGGLAACIQSTVRRWRFPSAGASTQTSFPVVFQPGG